MRIFSGKTSNPVFTNHFWMSSKVYTKDKLSIAGIIFKTLLMLALVTLAASFTWKLYFEGVEIKWYTTIGMFVALVCSLFISFKHSLAKYILPIYAIAKGFFLGGVSAAAHARFPNLPFQAVAVTLTTFFMMLFLYRFKIIKVTKKLRTIIISATASIFMFYFIAWILWFLNIDIPLLWGTSWYAILFNVFAAVVASFSLLLDFYYIDKQVGKAPKWKEWVATWGLLITLIWLYVEVLRLLRKLAIRF